MNIYDIKAAWSRGEYICHMEIPQKVKENHVFDEELSVKRNREMAIEHNEMVARLQKEKMHKNAELSKKLHDDVVTYIIDSYDMNEAQAHIVESYVYVEKHSFMCDYFGAIDEIASMVEDIIKSK